MKPHKDKKDFRHGLCWIVPFGQFKGGELFFRELGITVHMRPGVVLAFKSYELMHEVNAYKGWRYSLVLYQHQNMFC